MKRICLILLLLLIPACGPQTPSRVMKKNTSTNIDVLDTVNADTNTADLPSVTTEERLAVEETDSQDEDTIILPEALEATDEAVIID